MGTLSLPAPPARPAGTFAAVVRILRLTTLLGCFSAASLPGQTLPETRAGSVPLGLPAAIAYDRAGNLYIAESSFHVVRRVDPAGIITTIAGTGTQGFAGDLGPATAAQLDSPQALAIDPEGNVFLADTGNHRIREIVAASGVIHTIAGTGQAAYSGDGGPAGAAALRSPGALSFDPDGNFFIADTGNHRIRRIAAAPGLPNDLSGAQITTVAGTGTQGFSGDGGLALKAMLDRPSGLTVDRARLFLADTHNHRVRVVDLATGLISTLAGTGLNAFAGENGAAAQAAFALPRGLALDAQGNLFVADTRNHRIRRIDAQSHAVTTVAGQGTEAFSGDSGPASAADLDSPQAVAISPTGLITLADSGNQRIRQIDATASASGSDIHTLAGLGGTISGVLTLLSPGVLPYGTGSVTAALSSSTPATGAITFLDAAGSSPVTLITTPLSSNRALLNTASLHAGPHRLFATYPGDPGHPAAQASILLLVIRPATLTVTPSPAGLLFGQPLPAFTGSVTGVLPQDAASLSIAYRIEAPVPLPPGTYPITANLSGSSAQDYSLALTPAALTVSRAPTFTTLNASTGTASPGTPITFIAEVHTTTTGLPSGPLSLNEGTTVIASAPVNASGQATFTLATLPLGSHDLAAFYPGDADFLASVSTTRIVGIRPPSDFTVASSGPATHTIASGETTTFSFSLQPSAPLDSPITLAVSGLPPLASASFNPAYLPPGAQTASFTLTLKTVPLAAAARIPPPWWLAALLLLLPLPRRRARLLPFTLLILLAGCGDRVLSRLNPTGQSQTYPLTVTCTATGPTGAILQHTAAITLTIR